MPTTQSHRTAAFLAAVGLAAAWIGFSSRRGPVQAAAPSGTVLRHQFVNNIDAAKQPPDAKGLISVAFKTPLPAAPTLLLQSVNPRYSVKVHGASPTGFVYAIYRTRDLLDTPASDPYTGEGAAKPVTDYKAAQNIDIAWVAIAE